MSFLNLMRNRLKPKEVNDALENMTTPPADDVSYDNTDSGLTATNVQTAIDEVNSLLSNYVSTSDVTLKDNVRLEIGLYEMTYSGDTFTTTGIKVINGTRFFILGVVLGGSVNANKAYLYSSWNETTYLLN